MKKILLLSLPICMLTTHALGQSWQSSAPDILYGVNNLLGTAPIRVGIGTSLPVTPLHVQNGCVLFNGGTGATPVSGSGTRFMWIPDKAALRAGEVTGSQWNSINIGTHSGAIGNNTIASGVSSFAINNSTEATGEGSLAANGYTHATNLFASAFGDGSTASGLGSFASGDNTIASGDYSAAFNNTAQATNYGAFAINAATASGSNSFAAGQAKSTGNNTFAAGATHVDASGDYATAFGWSSKATGLASFAALGGQADGAFSVAIGENCGNGSRNGSICFSDWLAGPPIIVNDTDNQFKARYSGGYVFHSDGTPTVINTLTFQNGNLGVGVLTATEKVDIDGKLKVRTIPQDNTATQILVKGATDNVVKYRDISTITDQDWLTPAGTTPTSNSSDIHTEGKVGIGTGSSTPNAKLHIIKPACNGTTGLRISAAPTTVPFCSNVGDIFVAEGNSPSYSNVVEPRFVIKNTGSVGIGGGSGINDQRFLLDLYRGDMLFKGNPSECAFSYRLHYQYWTPNGEFFISPTNFDGSLIPGVTGIAMGTNGNVGIGTNSDPSNKLQIGGNIVPDANCSRDIGTATKRWNNIFLCNAPTIISDARLKENVRDIEYGLETIRRLRPVSYNLSSSPSSKRSLGLLAQETKEVINEIVYVGDDSEKTHGIRYSELIPVLIKAVQEQDKVLTERETKIKELEERIKRLENIGSNNSNGTGINTNTKTNVDDLLFQNTPNPFNGVTEIRYRIPQSYTDANIMIFDMNGKKIKSIAVQGAEGSVSVSASEMAAGLYLYSLIIDGREIATKRMVVNK